MFKNIVTGVVLAACMAPAFAAVEWMTDLEAAKTKAAAENKAILIDFTGSDWCGWCIRIRKEVFDTPRFEAYIKDKFVPVEIDLPQNPKFDAELRKRNQAICNQYNVQGFPTVMVTDARGSVAGGFVGGILEPEKVEKILDAGHANAKKLDAAQSLSGEAKAKVLCEVYRSLSEDMQESAQPMLDEIVKLDPNDATGLSHVLKVREQSEAFKQQLNNCKTPAEARQVVDAAVASAYPENRPMMLQVKSQVYLGTAETEADIIVARDAMLELVGSDSKQRIGIEKHFADPAAMLKQIKSMRRK